MANVQRAGADDLIALRTKSRELWRLTSEITPFRQGREGDGGVGEKGKTTNANPALQFHLSILRHTWPPILLALTASASLRAAEYAAVIDDPDGFSNVRYFPISAAILLDK